MTEYEIKEYYKNMAEIQEKFDAYVDFLDKPSGAVKQADQLAGD